MIHKDVIRVLNSVGLPVYRIKHNSISHSISSMSGSENVTRFPDEPEATVSRRECPAKGLPPEASPRTDMIDRGGSRGGSRGPGAGPRELRGNSKTILSEFESIGSHVLTSLNSLLYQMVSYDISAAGDRGALTRP